MDERPERPERPQPRLGVRLRRARIRLDLTQEQVARAVGFVPTVYGRIERGDMVPSTAKLRALCVLLGVSADELLSLRAEESKSTSPRTGEGTPPEQPAVKPPEDSRELRRLVLILRELSPDRFRLFRVALQSVAAREHEEKDEEVDQDPE